MPCTGALPGVHIRNDTRVRRRRHVVVFVIGYLPSSDYRCVFYRYARVNLVACPGGAKAVAPRLQKEGLAAKVWER